MSWRGDLGRLLLVGGGRRIGLFRSYELAVAVFSLAASSLRVHGGCVCVRTAEY